ncbi:flagellar hook-associated protein FlgK [Cycloclasticus sp. 46_120_T64]|nr:flagellar hook-associated protein FlgK [Cycloclasticus sp. 46_120_T64]
MAGNLLLTGLSGLSAFRSALDTTGHNIANVTTEGYSRQSVELDARPPQFSGFGYVGVGVETTAVTRAYDEFLATQFRSSSSATAELDSYFDLASQIDNVLTNENIGLSNGLQDFFNAVQAVSDDPTSIPARQALLTEGKAIEGSFATLDQLFADLTSQVNGRLNDTVSDINNLASSIASLNEKIILATGAGGGKIPNDLLDQRDHLVDQLSEKVNVSTNVQSNGAMNIFIGSGQALVFDQQSNSLAIQQTGFDVSAIDVVLQQKSGNIVVTQFMTGGEMGGSLRFRDEVLDPAINTLGQVAVSLSYTMNAQHNNGLDLNGAQGLDFFTDPTITPIKLAGTGTLAVSVANTTGLTTSDYTLTATGGNYTITRLSDNSVAAGPTAFATPATVDGLTFDTTGLVNGDSYRIRPTRDAAGDFKLFINDPREIAAAAPVISTVTPLNSGTGDISNVAVSGLLTNQLANATVDSNPITLTFDSANNEYDFSYGPGPTTGSVAYNPSTDNGVSRSITVGGFGTVSFTLSGNPTNADTLVLSDNTGGVGDNRNANLLADLQKALTLTGGTASFQDAYGGIVSDVGRKVQAAEANGLAQRGLLNQTIASKDSISGVNLDEEAANLIRFQQAYQAASQVILTSRAIFDTLLGAFR